MSRVVDAWTCVKCGSTASAEQNFCRVCGTPRGPKRPAPITAPVPVITRNTGPNGSTSPHSLVRLALIALLFVVVGGLAALALDDIRGDEPTNPNVDTTTVTTSGGATSTSG